ncbi:MAG: META domain-containing protein [Acidimicrobiales bacterium]
MSTRRVPMILLAVTAVLALVAGACGDDDVATGGDGSPEVDGGTDTGSFEGAWHLTSGVVDGEPVPLVEGHRITMTIAGGEVGGVAACNSYGGSVTIDDGSFSLGEVGWTAMGCEPAVTASEQAYLGGLMRATTVAHDGDAIVLVGDGVELRFDELPPVPTADLVDTVWGLDTIIDGETASTVAGEPATLELRSDGTLSGSTGCRTLTGTWLESGDTIVTPELAADGDCPDELARQDGHVIEVVGDGFTAEIDGQRLTLTSAGNIGLSFRAVAG